MKLLQKISYHVKDLIENFEYLYIISKIKLLIWRHITIKINKKLDIYEFHLYNELIPKKGSFVDIGANRGQHSLRISKMGFPVYAFEPNFQNYIYLLKLTHHIKNFHLFNFALGDKNETRFMYYNMDDSIGGTNSFIHPQKNHYLVPTQIKKLDDVPINDNIQVIKIDTEGYEIPILKGALLTIITFKPKLIVEIHKPWNEQIKEIRNILIPIHYNCKKIFKVTGQPHLICDPL